MYNPEKTVLATGMRFTMLTLLEIEAKIWKFSISESGIQDFLKCLALRAIVTDLK